MAVRVEPKALIASKTFWFGVLTIIIAIANLFGFADFIPSEGLLGIVGAVTIVLRLITKAPVERII